MAVETKRPAPRGARDRRILQCRPGPDALSVSTSTALFELRDSRVEFRSEPQAACATAPCLCGKTAATNSRRSRPRPEDLPLVWDCSKHALAVGIFYKAGHWPRDSEMSASCNC